MLFALDGRVLGGTQSSVLVEVLFCESDGRVLVGMLLVEVLFCESDGPDTEQKNASVS